MSAEFEHTESKQGKVIELDYERINRFESLITSPERQNAYAEILASNPNKIEGSIGNYLVALRPGLSLNEAENLQKQLTQTKPIDSFGIVDDDGDLIFAKSKDLKEEKLPLLKFDVSSEFVQAKKLDLESLPESHKLLLAGQKFRVELHRDIWNYDKKNGTNYATEPVDGYSTGHTGINVDVFFDKTNRIVAAMEYFKPRNFDKMISSGYVLNPSSRFIHEFGHAFSMAKNYDVETDFSIMNLFESLRKQVIKTPETFKDLSYFSQEPVLDKDGKIIEHPGLRETIAEFYALRFGGSTQTSRVKNKLIDAYRPIQEIMIEKGYLK